MDNNIQYPLGYYQQVTVEPQFHDPDFFKVIVVGDSTTVVPRPIEEIRAMLLEKVKRQLESRKMLGFPVPVGSTTYWFHNDLLSRSQHQDLHLRAAGMRSDEPLTDAQGNQLVWKVMNGLYVGMTAGIAASLAEHRNNFDNKLFMIAREFESKINAASMEELCLFDVTQGWPEAVQQEPFSVASGASI